MLEQGPYAVNVATPSDRGPLNGSGATEDGTLSAHFTRHAPRRAAPSATARGSRISGRLLNSSGRPISGALLRVLTRDRRQGAALRRALHDDHDVRRQLSRARCAPPPRGLTQIAWRSHANDPGFQESAYVTLLARASSSLKATPAHRSGSAGGCA